MVEDGDRRIGADAGDDSRQGHDAVGRSEVRDDDRSRDAQPVGDVDDDRRRGERRVQLCIEVGGLGHDLADRRRVVRRSDSKAPAGQLVVDLVTHDLSVDDHDERRPIGDQGLGRSDSRGDRIGGCADRTPRRGQLVAVEVELADAAVAPDLLGFCRRCRREGPLRGRRPQRAQPQSGPRARRKHRR